MERDAFRATLHAACSSKLGVDFVALCYSLLLKLFCLKIIKFKLFLKDKSID